MIHKKAAAEVRDLVDMAMSESAKEKFTRQAHQLFIESIARAQHRNPHAYFWTLCLEKKLRSKAPDEIRVWAITYLDELGDWLTLNYLNRSMWYPLGIYTEEEHVLSLH